MAIETASPAEVFKKLESGDGVVVDVRTPGEYAGVHVIGARLMPLDALDAGAVAALRSAPDSSIYVICRSGGRSVKACERLAAAGIGKVVSIEGGTAAWEKAGLPVERDRGVISLERQVRIVAGALVFIGAVLAWLVHPLFLIVPAFIGAGLVFAGVTDFCGMGLLLAKMPWNRAAR